MEKRLHFELSEFEARLARLRGAMVERGVEVVIVDQPGFVAWVSGYTPTDTRYRALVVPAAGTPTYALRSLDRTQAERRSWFARVIDYPDWEEPVEHVARHLAERGLAGVSIGLDFTSYALTLRRFETYRRLLPEAEFVDLAGLLPALGARKSAAELALIADAARIADSTMAAVVAGAGAGRTARDATRIAQASYLDGGADDGVVGPITIGRGEGFLHAGLEDDPLAPGDILHVELIPMVQGYGARLMRPILIGRADGERRRVAETLIGLQDAQLAAMRPGAPAADVDAVLREGLLASGLRRSIPHTTGYALGYYGRTERTSDFTRNFLPTSDWVLEAGMVFHMYIAAQGLAFSETMLVGEDGAHRLTRTKRRLFEV